VQFRTNSIALRRVPYRDADLILTLLTSAHGKLAALARSARTSRRRFGGALGLFSICEVELSRRPGSELYTVSSAVIRENYAALASDVVAFAHASYATELTRELLPAEQPDQAVFDLLNQFYANLMNGPSRSLLRAFELQLLGELGMAPVLDRCVVCNCQGAQLTRRALFDPDRGGTICGSCGVSSRGIGVRPLPERARELLCAVQMANPLAKARDLVAPPEVEVEARELSLALLGHHLGKSLKSLEFVRQLAGANPDS
jgi:DNA repair protein RecO (recombination protein O)